jgi:hypothetical protein
MPEANRPSHDVTRASRSEGYCLGLREEMPATAAITTLAPIKASSRTPFYWWSLGDGLRAQKISVSRILRCSVFRLRRSLTREVMI